MGFSVSLASFIVLIGFLSIFGAFTGGLFSGFKELSVTANDYVNRQTDKLNLQMGLTVDAVNTTSCQVTLKNVGSKIIFLQQSNGFNWNSIIVTYGNSGQWQSYLIDQYQVLNVKVVGSNATFNLATHNFVNSGEEATILIDLPNGAPPIASQDTVSVTLASYYGATAAGEAVKE